IIGLLVWMFKFREPTTKEIEDVRTAMIGEDIIAESGREDSNPYSSEIFRHATNGFPDENILGKGDLKIWNILLGPGKRAKVSDFGWIKILLSGENLKLKKERQQFILKQSWKKKVDETLGEEQFNVAMWLRPKLRNENFWKALDEAIVTDNKETLASIEKIAKVGKKLHIFRAVLFFYVFIWA
ncbi:hypothetical protein EUTSA_v10022382mg, partial [Eutrema salsugineum]